MKRFKGKLFFNLIGMTVLPVVIIGVIITLSGVAAVHSSYDKEIYSMLMGVSLQLRSDFTAKFPGDYSNSVYNYYSGDENIHDEGTRMIDSYKNHFGVELTIFYGNTRALTTLVDDHGDRITGSKQNDLRVTRAIKSGESFTANDVLIYGERYHVVYIPLYDNGEPFGMVFAGISSSDVNNDVREFTTQIFVALGIVVLFVGTIVLLYSRHMSRQISDIKEYLGQLTKKQTDAVIMADKVLRRHDEIGELGRYAVEVGEQLKTIMGLDPLTHLYNRRTGNQYLESLWLKSRDGEVPFTLIMCDIDFFKKVNDTYGHDTGDDVLMEVASVFLKYTSGSEDSFAVRWGGEEFLLGFCKPLDETLKIIEAARTDIKQLTFNHGSRIFKITMTFGVATYEPSMLSVEALITAADENLYRGKNSGRDCIITPQ